MEIGIIIICYNNEVDLNEEAFNGLSNIAKNIQLCFVNNGSKDNTLDKLQKLKEAFESDITIIDIKKNKGNELAIKAGARYLLNTINLKHIGYICLKDFNPKLDLKDFLDIINDSKEELITYNLLTIENKRITRLLIKNVFSVLEYFKHLKIDYKKQKLKTMA